MWRFDYFTEGFVGRAIDKMIEEWDAAGTPVEARLAEALQKLELAYEDRLRLQWRVHCQRKALREHWEIVEMRAQYKRCWYPSKLLTACLQRAVQYRQAMMAGNET
jgi:hypothetical protein